MSTMVLIIGESGAGKSTSIRTLPPEETFIINVQSKPLPFKDGQKNYSQLTKDNTSGNILNTDQSTSIIKTINYINEQRPDIKNIVIDDAQYILANMFMARSKEKGFEKFNDMGKSYFDIILAATKLPREDITLYFMSHTDVDEYGVTRCKTIGKLLNDKVCVEGLFTICLLAVARDGQYKFVTQNNGRSTAKSPMGMFETLEIPNDLNLVAAAIKNYWED